MLKPLQPFSFVGYETATKGVVFQGARGEFRRRRKVRYAPLAGMPTSARSLAPPSPHKACALRGPLGCFRRLSFTPLLRLFPTKLRFAGAPERHLPLTKGRQGFAVSNSVLRRAVPALHLVPHRAATARRLGQAPHRTLHKQQAVQFV